MGAPVPPGHCVDDALPSGQQVVLAYTENPHPVEMHYDELTEQWVDRSGRKALGVRFWKTKAQFQRDLGEVADNIIRPKLKPHLKQQSWDQKAEA
ncbi:hypothetical protein BGE01nite_23770 [Brevifollis gellanilyticus]|uniref:Uncharacterized protein n=1 Tax=Brevifollis gellanilyticus TaxID=748831 RepID=A0A512M8L9_9BACT|nr:hypothetical protein BGE01nite_23770 [Brevifollis gellanilyticus]